MLAELELALASTPANAGIAEFRKAVVAENVLGKRSATTREHTVRKLKALYGLDPRVAIYRIMRDLWNRDTAGRPLLALMCASARDPILRASIPSVVAAEVGASLPPDSFHSAIGTRFSESTAQATVSHLFSTWTQAGFLLGPPRWIKAKPCATPGSATYALALGYMEGVRGGMLLSTTWARLLERPRAELLELLRIAAATGWIELRFLGDIVSVDLDRLFTEEERVWCRAEPD